MRPFVKWVGGKTQLLSVLEQILPHSFNRYFEPFLGGGALFLKIKPKKAFLSDANSQLIAAWKVVQQSPNQLTNQLQILTNDFHASVDKGQFFKKRRDEYNDFLTNQSKDTIRQTALLIFLNKTGFNGLYRVNKAGKFNVPWNKAEKVNLYSKKNLELISTFLSQNVVCFRSCDFAEILSEVKKGDFVYLDPPYDLLEKKASFVSYHKDKFLSSQQKRLSQFFQALDKKGCFVALSNHKTPTIEHLYQNYHVQIVSAKRMINCQGDKRGSVNEVIITNYQTSLKKSPGVNDQSEKTTLFSEMNSIFDVFRVYRLPEWYVDFDKVKKNVTTYQKHVQQLEKVVHLPNLESNLFYLVKKDVTFLKLLFLLIGYRWDNSPLYKEWNLADKTTLTTNKWKKVFTFLEQTGLIKELAKGTVKRIFDYLFGVEVGLDSNARKNRSGELMEKKVQEILEHKKQAGEILWYENKKKLKNLSNKHQLKAAQRLVSIEDKVFDFIYQKQNTVYLVETNYYNTAGSKITEIIRAYQKINDDIAKNSLELKFVWISDGIYWYQNPKVWKETQQKFKHLLCLKDFQTF